jgi:hypothetical protein
VPPSDPTDPRERLERAIVRGDVDESYVDHVGKALDRFEAFAGGLPFPERRYAEAYFDHLAGRFVGIDWVWTAFQHAAAAAWGVAETAHLQAVLRARRSRAGSRRTSERQKLDRALARLPDVYREPFVAVLGEQGRTPSPPAELVQRTWCFDRLRATMRALGYYARWAEANGKPYLPVASVDFQAFAEATWARPSVNTALTVGTYLQMIVRALRGVVAFNAGWDFTGLDLVRDRWLADGAHSNVRAKPGRIVSALELYELGFRLIGEARVASVRTTSAVLAYRNGLLLALGICVPVRARALECLQRDVTIRVHHGRDGRPLIVEIDIPGERTKDGRPFRRAFENAELAGALVEYWREFRAILDDAAWLWPSARRPGERIGRARLGQLCSELTARHLGRAVNVHLLRDCAVTSWIELDPVAGPAKGSALLGHGSLEMTRQHYAHADSLMSQHDWAEHRRSTTGGKKFPSFSFLGCQ